MRSELWTGDPVTDLPTAGQLLKEQQAEFDAQGYDDGYGRIRQRKNVVSKLAGFLVGAGVAAVAVWGFKTWRHVSDEDRLMSRIVLTNVSPISSRATLPSKTWVVRSGSMTVRTPTTD